tara:strand:+ start:1202 stop:1375 length:174 start_codon:yes stop_codon:yes gene_type:complete
MHSIEFISFNEDNQPQTKVYEGDQIADLLLNEDEIGQIITDCMFGKGKVNINEEKKQ